VDPGRLDLPGGGDQFLFAPWRRMGDGPVIGCTARGKQLLMSENTWHCITIPGACTRRWVTRHRWITNRTLTKCAKLVNHYKTAKWTSFEQGRYTEFFTDSILTVFPY
jgi:hypothetical protein